MRQINNNEIETVLGICYRNKYERQSPFRLRVNVWFRKQIKSMYKHNFKDTKETGVVLKFPLNDLNGLSVLDYQFDRNRITIEGIKWKYICLKIKFYEGDEDETD